MKFKFNNQSLMAGVNLLSGIANAAMMSQMMGPDQQVSPNASESGVVGQSDYLSGAGILQPRPTADPNQDLVSQIASQQIMSSMPYFFGYRGANK